MAGLFPGDASASLRMDLAAINSAASIKLSETASGMRLEDTAAGRRFLRDTAAGIRLGKLSESSANIKLGDTSAGVKLTDTAVGRKVGPPSQRGASALTGTLASFGQPLPPPVEVLPDEGARTSEIPTSREAMRRTVRGLDAASVKPPPPSGSGGGAS